MFNVHDCLPNLQSSERFYPETNVKIDGISVQLLQAYNDTKMDKVFDERFIYFTLVSIMTAGEKRTNSIDANKMDFARKIFKHRLRNVSDSNERFAAFDIHAKSLISNIRDNYKKMRI